MTEDNPPTGELAGPVIAELITKEAESARTVAASLQSRGLAVISSSGTLVTLLFGLSALATKAQNFVLPPGTKLPLYLAAALLVLAAIAGIVTNAPRHSDAIDLAKMGPLLEDDLWAASAADAKPKVARAQLKVAVAARKLNTTMARFLIAGIALEIAGVACVMWAVIALIAAG